MLSLLSRILPHSTYVIVHLNENTLLLAHALQDIRKLHILDAAQHALDNNHRNREKIFNLSLINKYIKEYAILKNIKDVQVLLYVDHIDTIYNLLQNLLCASKGGFSIKAVFTGNPPCSLLNKFATPHHIYDECHSRKTLTSKGNLISTMLPEYYNSSTPWLGCFMLSLVFFFWASISTYLLYIKEGDLNIQTNTTLSTTLTALKEDVKKVHETKNKLAALSKKKNVLSKKQQSLNNPTDLLKTIASIMPPQSKLTSLCIGKEEQRHRNTNASQTRSQQKYEPLALEGLTLDPSEIGTFVKKLSQLFPHQHFSLLLQDSKKTITSLELNPVHQKFIIKSIM